jgi:hypothetical protein
LQARRAASDVLLDIALQLLEVLGPQVHAFGPHHAIRQRLRVGALPASARIANCHQRTSWGVPTLKREALADVLPIDSLFFSDATRRFLRFAPNFSCELLALFSYKAQKLTTW